MRASKLWLIAGRGGAGPAGAGAGRGRRAGARRRRRRRRRRRPARRRPARRRRPAGRGARPPAGSALESETGVAEISADELPPPPPPVEIPDHARRDPWVVGRLDPVQLGLGPKPVGRGQRRLPVEPDAAHRSAARLALGAYCAAQRACSPRPGRRATSIRSTGSPSAPGCCCGWARPTPRGCWCRASTSIDFTPKMFQVAVQSALANADPSALCPLQDGIRKRRAADLPAGRRDVRLAVGRAGERRRADRRGAPPRPHRRHRPGARRKRSSAPAPTPAAR